MDRKTIETRLELLHASDTVGTPYDIVQYRKNISSLLLAPQDPVMTPCVSSNVESFSYDEASSCLTVVFKGGSRYRYLDVSYEDGKAFVESESKGKALQPLKAKYRCVKDAVIIG